MRIRRCAVLWLEAAERAWFDLEDVLVGGTGVRTAQTWKAHAPHLQMPVVVDAADLPLLGDVSPSHWRPARGLHATHGAQRVRHLLRSGLLIGSTKPWAAQRAADDRCRETGWFGAAALWHQASRWQGVDSAGQAAQLGIETAQGLRERHGPPPAAVLTRAGATARAALPPAEHDAFDALLDARVTCRNFDPAAALPLEVLSRMLVRVFGLRGRVQAADDFDLLKRSSPSGGGLHPTECYLLVQRVDGLAPGLYHYNVGAHALDALPVPEEFDRTSFAQTAVAGQHWFAEAPVLCVLAPRFGRNFWKYRNHAKAYRVCILDIGHLSQTLQLCATREGLGSFITAAINEADIERAFGLDGYAEGALAVCGFGRRAAVQHMQEFDPNGRVWPPAG